MATGTRTTTTTTTTTTGSGYRSPISKTVVRRQQDILFDKENYMWMIGGILLIFIGFMLMSGGKSPNPHEFNYAEIYSFRRITLAPIVILLGFATEVYAIMKKPKDTEVAVVTNEDIVVTKTQA